MDSTDVAPDDLAAPAESAPSLLEALARPAFEGLTTRELLGAGGQALVYAADGPDGPVAVKRWEAASAEAGRRELAALRRLPVHPHVVRLVGVTRSPGDGPDDAPCAVLEALPGRTLARAIEEDGPLTPERVAELGRALADALEHLHAHGVVHGDVKPSNVALRADGGPVLFDLGAAAPPGAVASGGSPPYMAPEQFVDFAPPDDGDRAPLRVGPATDVYLLGATLFEAATGRPPWAADDGPRARWSHPEDAWRDVPVGLAAGLRRVIARCLEGSPARRYARPGALADDLRRLLEAPRRVAALVAVGLSAPPAHDAPERAALEAWLRRRLDEGGGRVADGDAFELRATFDRASDAAATALRIVHGSDDAGVTWRAAVHLGEVALVPEQGLEGEAAEVARRLLRAARPGQVLLSTAAFTEARRHVAPDLLAPRTIAWRALGRFRLPGLGALERAEVIGWVGPADAAAEGPTESRGVVRARGGDDHDLFDGSGGWRPSAGAAVPDAPDYRLERRLGAGGGGEVWLARHRIHAQPVAVKFTFDPDLVRQLRRERVIAQVLGRQGVFARRRDIARVEAAHLDGPPHYVISEYVDGGDLHAWAERRGGAGRAPLAERARIAAAAARALAAAHAAGVLHRDVKPANILVDLDGAVRIADFGLGRLTVARDRARDLAGSSAPLTEALDDESGGTRLYLAPEVVEGQPPTAHSDVYSLGVVLHQLLCGDLTRALGEGWERDVGLALAGEDEVTAELLVEDVRACIERDPSRRLRGAAELADRLEGLAARRQARHDARRAATRRRALGWLGAALAAALVVGLAVLWNDRVRLAELRRLADVATLEQLEREASAGWPVTSKSLPALDAWLAAAEDLAARRPVHEATLGRLRAEATPAGSGWRFARPELKWEHDTLADLVARLSALEADGPDVRGSLAWARRRRADTVEWERAWREALPSIAAVYTGLVVEPQVGLVPLRVDPAAGLWELWHPDSGVRPAVGADGRLVMDAAASLVFVLVPGGRVRPGRAGGLPDEAPAGQVELAPFFLAKHEMTQAQWARVAGANPSAHRPGEERSVLPATRARETRFSVTQPVEQVSWNDCRHVLGPLGLTLPTEAQWEWAARGPDDRLLPWGDAPPDATRAVCLLRSQFEGAGPRPVGQRPAGASWCGVEDLAGNVLEWCLDLYAESYAARPAEAGSGRRRIAPPAAWLRTLRGGSWCRYPPDLPAHRRFTFQATAVTQEVGCRPARPLVRADEAVAFDPLEGQLEEEQDGAPVEPYQLEVLFDGAGDPARVGFQGGHPFELDAGPGLLRQELDVGVAFPYVLGRERFLAVANARTGWVLEARVHVLEHRPEPGKNPWGAFLEARDEHGGVQVLFLPEEVRVFEFGGDPREAQVVSPGRGFRRVRVEVAGGHHAADAPRPARLWIDDAGPLALTLSNSYGGLDPQMPNVRFGDGSKGAGAAALWDLVRLSRWAP